MDSNTKGALSRPESNSKVVLYLPYPWKTPTESWSGYISYQSCLDIKWLLPGTGRRAVLQVVHSNPILQMSKLTVKGHALSPIPDLTDLRLTAPEPDSHRKHWLMRSLSLKGGARYALQTGSRCSHLASAAAPQPFSLGLLLLTAARGIYLKLQSLIHPRPLPLKKSSPSSVFRRAQRPWSAG